MVKVVFRDKEWELRAGMTVRDAILKVRGWTLRLSCLCAMAS